MRHRTGVLGVAIVALFSGCTDSPTDPGSDVVSLPDVRGFVEGSALLALDANGHFVIPAPSISGPHAAISREFATEVALGVIRSLYANPNVHDIGDLGLKEAAEQAHGGIIDWNSVRRGPREAYFAESHLEALDPSVPAQILRHIGPRFIVPLYVGNIPVVSVSVSAFATNVSFDSRGFILRSGPIMGNEFRTTGIPLASGGITLPAAPEDVVAFVFAETERKISEVPTLGVPGGNVNSLGARWRVRLAEPVEFERLFDGTRVTTQEVFVGTWPSISDARVGFYGTGAGLRMFVEAPEQPAGETHGGIAFPVREGYAVQLHEVRVVK